MSESIQIDDIKLWSSWRGAACIVLAVQDYGWVTTACGSLRTDDPTEKKPKRICRKCREALPNLRRAPAETPAFCAATFGGLDSCTLSPGHRGLHVGADSSWPRDPDGGA